MKDIRTYIFLLTILCSLKSFGQTKTRDINAGGFQLQSSTVDTTLNFLYCSIGEIPKFPGGDSKLISFAKKHIKYPKSAIRDSVEGKVVVKFTVDTKGKVTDEKIFKSVRTDIDTLCLAMLRQMPTWTAGRLEGKAVAVSFMWTIKFTLTSRKKQ